MRLKTEIIHVKSEVDPDTTLNFKVNIDVSKGGVFSAILPSDIVEMYESANIIINTNRIGTKGYYAESNIDNLIKSITKDAQSYLTTDMISSDIVIRYAIETCASYCVNNGDFVPNAGWGHDERYWINGTVSSNATYPKPFGINIFARPYKKQVFKVRSTGKTFVKNTLISGITNEYKGKPNLNFLIGICGVSDKGMKVQEIEYNEVNAKFFVDLYKSIFMLNEKIKPFIEPENLQLLIDSQKKLF